MFILNRFISKTSNLLLSSAEQSYLPLVERWIDKNYWARTKTYFSNCFILLYKCILQVGLIVVLLSTQLVPKQQFWENMTCWQRFCFVNIIIYYFEKERIHLKTKYSKNKPSKRLDCLRKSALSSECSGMLDAQPATVYPTSLDDPSRDAKFGFWSEHHCIYLLTIVLSTIVAIGMKFDLTYRQIICRRWH